MDAQRSRAFSSGGLDPDYLPSSSRQGPASFSVPLIGASSDATSGGLGDGARTGTDRRNKAKVRKPYTITKQRERWTDEEHARFLEALKLYGRAWRRIEEHIGSKTAVQIRSHAQKFFCKLEREQGTQGGAAAGLEDISIPPPRPKRKPAHPYPRKAHGSGSTQAQPGLPGLQFPDFAALALDGEAGEATVAAVAAAASAAAAAAAAAVVAAAGEHVQAKLQASPPQGFPFFGLPPSVLATMGRSGASSAQALAMAQLGNAQRQRVANVQNANAKLAGERTATSDGPGGAVTGAAGSAAPAAQQPPQAAGSDGNSACSCEEDGAGEGENDGDDERDEAQLRPCGREATVARRAAAGREQDAEEEEEEGEVAVNDNGATSGAVAAQATKPKAAPPLSPWQAHLAAGAGVSAGALPPWQMHLAGLWPGAAASAEAPTAANLSSGIAAAAAAAASYWGLGGFSAMQPIAGVVVDVPSASTQTRAGSGSKQAQGAPTAGDAAARRAERKARQAEQDKTTANAESGADKRESGGDREGPQSYGATFARASSSPSGLAGGADGADAAGKRSGGGGGSNGSGCNDTDTSNVPAGYAPGGECQFEADQGEGSGSNPMGNGSSRDGSNGNGNGSSGNGNGSSGNGNGSSGNGNGSSGADGAGRSIKDSNTGNGCSGNTLQKETLTGNGTSKVATAHAHAHSGHAHAHPAAKAAHAAAPPSKAVNAHAIANGTAAVRSKPAAGSGTGQGSDGNGSNGQGSQAYNGNGATEGPGSKGNSDEGRSSCEPDAAAAAAEEAAAGAYGPQRSLMGAHALQAATAVALQQAGVHPYFLQPAYNPQLAQLHQQALLQWGASGAAGFDMHSMFSSLFGEVHPLAASQQAQPAGAAAQLAALQHHRHQAGEVARASSALASNDTVFDAPGGGAERLRSAALPSASGHDGGGSGFKPYNKAAALGGGLHGSGGGHAGAPLGLGQHKRGALALSPFAAVSQHHPEAGPPRKRPHTCAFGSDAAPQ